MGSPKKANWAQWELNHERPSEQEDNYPIPLARLR